jgi:hypothetical protein
VKNSKEKTEKPKIVIKPRRERPVLIASHL